MYEPEIQKIEEMSEAKIRYMRRSPLGYLVLSALAGVYLGFGIVLIFSIGGPIAQAGGAPFLKLIMGASFGIALSLVVFAGSELFTGNNMVFAVGRLRKRVGVGPVAVLFALCFAGNLLGSVFLAWLVVQSGSLTASAQELIVKVAAMKMGLDPKEAFLRGVLCNWLVCLAVWVSHRTQNDAAKLILIFWCLFAFIASGFEHSIANQTLLSLGLFVPHGPGVSLPGFLHNQFYVTLGNLVGGGLMVGTVYWFAAFPSRILPNP
ncbi:MAG: nitrite transporter NirC, partial [Nitrospinaceae bacterium]|nr:formate/nitrite transporter family protein [Nitrospinaceae bacterium]NIR55910.1 formate/nitrite transporter family protein [Nitrospinaceae bacterium]NIS86357.1 formate/nitrite transporter family protein [Nitrospinaceae bacterium]NIT83193.1 formate/nitrite transporter family protein [Nitrospinaceae bacterium]NIU45404.1 formate/nitrite transporter family protein [Nitrospinaceae bacterium]